MSLSPKFSQAMFSVQDRVTLVSGGSRGIGFAIAQGFANAGAKVIITGRELDTLQSAAETISASENPPQFPVQYEVCDVSQESAIHNTVSKVHRDHERIDTLINVAGVNRRKKVEDVTGEDYDFILDINLKARL